jgi:HrpA-like RNA helicase
MLFHYMYSNMTTLTILICMQILVDTGFVKQKAYDPSKGMESLVTVPISKVRNNVVLVFIT